MKAVKDLVIHFYTDSFRGSITQAKSVTEAIRRRCDVKDLVLSQEIHCSVASTLLQSILLRGEERVRTISEHSHESYRIFYNSTVYCEKWGPNYIRGFADKHEVNEIGGKSSFMIGKTLYGATEEYKSIHTIDQPILGLTEKDLQIFFDISEQIPSRLYINSAGWNNENYENTGLGLLLQLLPGVEKKHLDEVYLGLRSTAAFKQLHKEALSEDNFREIFASVKEEIGYRVNEYEFKCNCSRDSMISFLQKLDSTQIIALRQEVQVIACNHCNERYEITPEELNPLLHTVAEFNKKEED